MDPAPYTPYLGGASAAAANEDEEAEEEAEEAEAELADYEDEDLLRHLGFANDAEVSDPELLAALEQHRRDAEDAGQDDLAHFYRLVHARFFPSSSSNGSGGEDAAEGEAADEEDENEAAALHAHKRARLVLQEPLEDAAAAAAAKTTRGVATSVIEVPYQRGAVNPLERKTYTRIVQLDSQNRDANQLNSTSYLFDLGEKLQNVVKLSLYAISIPYHWYTVGNAYGSNFFYLVATAPGINGGGGGAGAAQNIQVQVPPGNYASAEELVGAVQKALLALPSKYPAVTFHNSTTISRDPNTNRATLSFDLQNTFEDPFWVAQVNPAPEYYGAPPFAFPTDTDVVRAATLSAYLGFNRPRYNLSCAYSRPLVVPVAGSAALLDRQVTITSTNQRVTIVHYTNAVAASASASSAASADGTGVPTFYDYDPEEEEQPPTATPSTLLGAPIVLTVPVGTYTLRALLVALNGLMAAEPRLDMAPAYQHGHPAAGAAFGAVDTAATTPANEAALPQLPLAGTYLDVERLQDRSLVNTGFDNNELQPRFQHQFYDYARFVWSVRLRRSAANPPTPRAKLAIVLPSAEDDADHVWWGGSSSTTGFNFGAQVLELQTTLAETPLQASNFQVAAGTFFQYKLNTDRVSTLTLPPAALKSHEVARTEEAGYTLAEYLSALNAALGALTLAAAPKYFAPATTVASLSPTGLFQLTTGYARAFGSSHFTFSCAGCLFGRRTSEDVNNTKLGIDDPQSPLTDDAIQLTGSFSSGGSYPVPTNAVLFRLGLSDAGRAAGFVETTTIDNTTTAFPLDVKFVHAQTSTGDPKTFYFLGELLTQLQISLAQFQDADGARLLSDCELAFNASSGTVEVTFTLVIAKRLTEADLVLELYEGVDDDGEPALAAASGGSLSFLRDNLKLGNHTYTLADASQGSAAAGGAFRRILGTEGLQSDVLTLAEDTPWTCFAADDADPANRAAPGSDAALAGAAPVSIVVPAGVYTRQLLFSTMNAQFAATPELAGTALQTTAPNALGDVFCQVRWSVHRAFGPEDYQLLFYSPELFQRCVASSSAHYLTANVVPTQTLGWTLGFHTLTNYVLAADRQVPPPADAPLGTLSTYAGTTSAFQVTRDASGRARAALTGNATVNVNPYATLYLTLDDFSQNRANDTVVSIGARDTQYSLAAGGTRRVSQCDAATNEPFIAGTSAAHMQTLTRAVVYANAVVLDAFDADKVRQKNSTASSAAFVPTDTLAVLPLKLGSTQFGQTFTENAGSLAVMNRQYTGPVKFARGRIQLLTDRGVPLDLNGQNWSVTLLCEVLATPAALGTA